jgi:hypothetical protein
MDPRGQVALRTASLFAASCGAAACPVPTCTLSRSPCNLRAAQLGQRCHCHWLLSQGQAERATAPPSPATACLKSPAPFNPALLALGEVVTSNRVQGAVFCMHGAYQVGPGTEVMARGAKDRGAVQGGDGSMHVKVTWTGSWSRPRLGGWSMISIGYRVPLQFGPCLDGWIGGEKHCIRIPVAFCLYLIKIIQILTN